ncbi:MAG: hypothetical protein ABF289_17550, partial [Clostridiales bacterium]
MDSILKIPDHIVLKDDNDNGIMSEEYLKGILVIMCNELKIMGAIIEFDNSESKCNKIYPEFLYGYLRRVCKHLQENNNDNGFSCEENDCKHAYLFNKLKKKNLNDKLKSACIKNKYINKYYEEDKSFGIRSPKEIVRRKFGKVFLEYDCSKTFFRELIFPIFLGEDIIATFIIGQIVLKDNEEKIKMRLEEEKKRISSKSEGNSWFRNRFNTELDYLNYEKNIKAYRKVDKYFKPLNKAAYEELIKKVLDELEELESRLESETLERQKLKITIFIENAKKKYYKEIDRISLEFKDNNFKKKIIGIRD